MEIICNLTVSFIPFYFIKKQWFIVHSGVYFSCGQSTECMSFIDWTRAKKKITGRFKIRKLLTLLNRSFFSEWKYTMEKICAKVRNVTGFILQVVCMVYCKSWRKKTKVNSHVNCHYYFFHSFNSYPYPNRWWCNAIVCRGNIW